MNEKILQAMRNGDVEWLRQHLGHMGARFTFFKEEKSSVPTYFHAAWNSPNPGVLLEFLNKSKSSKDSWLASQGRWAFDTVNFLKIFNGWGTFSPRGLTIPSVSEILLTADYTHPDVRKKATAFIQFMSRSVKNIDGLYEYQGYVDSYVKLFKDILRKLLLEGTPKQIKQTLMTDMPKFLNFFDPTLSDLTKTLTIREAVKSKARLINLSLLVNLIYQDALSQLGEDFVKQWDQNYEAIVDLLEKHEVVSVIDGVDGVWLFDGKTSFPAKYIIPILRKLESAVEKGVWNNWLYMIASRFASQNQLDTVYGISQLSPDFFLLGYLKNFERGILPKDVFDNDLVQKFYKDCLFKHKLSEVVEAIFKSKVSKVSLKEAVEFLEQHGVMLRQDIQNAGINISEYVERLKGTQSDKDSLLRFFQQVPAAAPEVVEEEALPTYEEAVSQGIPPELAKETELSRAIEEAPPKYSKFDTEMPEKERAELSQEENLVQENASLKRELAAAYERIHALEDMQRMQETRMAQTFELAEKSEQSQARANKDLSKLHQENVVLKAELERVLSEHAAQTKSFARISESGEQRAKELEGVVAKQKKTITDLEQKNAAAEEQMKAMQREMARLKAQLAESQKAAVPQAQAARPASLHPDSPLLSQLPAVPSEEPGAVKSQQQEEPKAVKSKKKQLDINPPG